MKNSPGPLLKGLYVKFVAFIKHIFGIAPYIPEADRVSGLSPEERISKEVDMLLATTKDSVKLYGRENSAGLRVIAHSIVANVPNLLELQDRYLALQEEYDVKNRQINNQPNRAYLTGLEHEHELVRRNIHTVYKNMRAASDALEHIRREMAESLLTVAQNLQKEEHRQILGGRLGTERYKKATRYEGDYKRRSDGPLWETSYSSWRTVTRYIFELDNPDTSRQDSIWLLLVTHTPIEAREIFQIEVHPKDGRIEERATATSDQGVRQPTGTLGAEKIEFCTTSVQQMNEDELRAIALFKSGRKKSARNS